MSESPFDSNDLRRDIPPTLARLAARGAVFSPGRDADRFDCDLPDQAFTPPDSRLVVDYLRRHAGEVAAHVCEVASAFDSAWERLEFAITERTDSRSELESAQERLVGMRKGLYPVADDFGRVADKASRLLEHRPALVRRRSSTSRAK